MNDKPEPQANANQTADGAAATARPPVDWERIEADYRAGILSLREIASLHPGTNHVAITRKAKALGWTKDLNAKIRARAEELVTKQAVTKSVTGVSPATERQIIDANANQLVEVRVAHRRDISKARTMAMKLMDRLEEVCTIESSKVLDRLDKLISKSGDDDFRDAAAQINESLAKLTALPGLVKVLKDLSEALRTLITMERTAYGLDDPEGPPPELAEQARVTRPMTDAERAVRLHALLGKKRGESA
ncbi:hypothetical protein PSQ40_04875 [Curvibacter sp. HBC61]|uniref:Terminase n=1 Tax=Curvibacter cyanobacteriorum TaxID=3026422 RepID=A0ABT5MV29_9BURK|nr:hypothetical protein [Curvibacter sp. HBC61]MDD0837899.1 hypothetical protein [Curvibacter sp. HBC61]